MMNLFHKKTQQQERTLFFKKVTTNTDSDYVFYLKKFLRILKITLYAFSSLMIAWSFIQSFAQPFTNYSAQPGAGLEFGFYPGSLGEAGKNVNYKYEVFCLELNPLNFHAFFEPNKRYGLFLSIFVYPFAWIFINLIYSIGQAHTFLEESGLNVIFAIVIILCFMRSFTFLATLRGAYYMEKQHHHKSYLDKINSKYGDNLDYAGKGQKQAEISAYNKKNNLKQFAQFENFFIITPIFLIVFKLVTITRPIKFTTLFGIWELAKTPMTMIFSHFLEGGWAYLLLCLIIMPVNFLSQKAPMWLSQYRNPHLKNSDANNPHMANTKKIQAVLTIVFLCFTFFWSSGLAIYYFFNSLFTIGQSFMIHFLLVRWNKKKNTFKSQLKKLGIE